MSEPTELERRVALAIAKLYGDDARAEMRAQFLIGHARAAIAEVMDHIFPSRTEVETDADTTAQRG